MCDHDIKNIPIELEHFYTVLKNNDSVFEPSVMIDNAWHHHILITRMYRTFSRQHFGMELLHHVPFWSENMKEIEEVSNANEEFDSIATYNTIVSMFDSKNVSKTMWDISEHELNDDRLETVGHNEF